jgi:hypothetical protein
MVASREADINKRAPFRSSRLANELEPGFVRKPIALLRIAGNAGADDVFPGGLATTVSRKNMIKVQLLPLKNLTAILTSVPVPLEHVVPGELYFFLRQSLEQQQHDNPWNANAHGNRMHHFRFGIGARKVAPAREIMGQIVVGTVRGNHLSMPLVKECESSTNRTCIYRLPEAVENKYGLFKDAFHFALVRLRLAQSRKFLRAS